MFMKRPKHRIFDYPSRFYKPEDDIIERKKRKLGFKRARKHTQRRRSSLLWIVLFFLAVLTYIKLSGINIF